MNPLTWQPNQPHRTRTKRKSLSTFSPGLYVLHAGEGDAAMPHTVMPSTKPKPPTPTPAHWQCIEHYWRVMRSHYTMCLGAHDWNRNKSEVSQIFTT